jgi:D-3-phosphoglycerate dehydrogenase
VRRGDWELRNDFGARELAHKRLLLLGFGRIGRQVARRALAFDMTVLVHDPVIDGETIVAAGALPVADWRGRLAEADFVSLHLPLMPETANMIGRAELAAMKSSTYLINAARGGLIDEAALLEALLPSKPSRRRWTTPCWPIPRWCSRRTRPRSPRSAPCAWRWSRRATCWPGWMASSIRIW